MKFPFRISLYYKLFFVFGLTFLGVVQIMGDSLTKPFEEDDVRIIMVQAVSCMALIVINALIVRRLIQPLRELTAFSQEFSEGKFGKRISRAPNDEIGVLAQALNSMADRIQRQMESLKHMAIGVSHEIRSPLTRMRMVVEMLPDQDSKSVLSSQIQELDAITAVILDREALDSGLSELKLQAVSFSDLFEDLASYYVSLSRTIKITGKPLAVQADRRRLEMCFKNLIDNGFQYGGGAQVEVEWESKEKFVEVRITNSGILDKPKSSGYGLGLLLSESIAKAHRGSLSVVNVAGGGTCATVRIAT